MHRTRFEPVASAPARARRAAWSIAPFPPSTAAQIVFGTLVLCAVLIGATSGRAHAFHAGAQFDDAPGKGGGGGLFYTGAPVEKGWDCTACHIQSEGKIRVNLRTTPASLAQSTTYTGGIAYTFSIGIAGEHLGLSSARSNFNGFALMFVDAQGRPAGSISGYAPEDIYQGGDAKIVSTGKQVGTSTWSFTWTAPKAGTGIVTLYLAMVDGNGANSPPTVTQTDPFGDDVIAVKMTLKDATVAAAAMPPTPPLDPAPRHSARPLWASHVHPSVGLGGLDHESDLSRSWLACGRRAAVRLRRALRRRRHRQRSLSERHL